MSKIKKPLRAVLALSGGMDSSSLLIHLLARGYQVKVLSFNYGQKHVVELERAKSLIKYLDQVGPNQDPVTRARYYKMIKDHVIVDISSLAPLLDSNLVEGGADVPEGHYESSNMKETVVPNRNKIFSSILQSVALSWANQVGAEVKIAMGIHSGDHCFTKDTEFLTPEGIKPLSSLNIGDAIYSYNMEKNTLEEDTLTDVIRKNVVSKVKQITTSAGTLKLTDEHNVFKLNLGNYDSAKGYEKSIMKVKAKELKVGDKIVSPINSKVLVKKSIPSMTVASSTEYPVEDRDSSYEEVYDVLPLLDSIVDRSDILKQVVDCEDTVYLKTSSRLKEMPRFVDKRLLFNILGWYITEGWTVQPKNSRNSRFSSGISQSLAKNFSKTDSILEDFKNSKLPVKYEFSKKFVNKVPQEVTFYISGTLSAIMQTCGIGSAEKHIPSWLFKELISGSKSILESFFEVLIAGDGFKSLRDFGYCSNSFRLIKQVAYLGNLLGYGVSILYPKEGSSTYYLNFKSVQRKIAASCLGEGLFGTVTGIEDIDYNDFVYDITVNNNNNFFAGDLGQILISNSIYPDCRKEFRDADYKAFTEGNWNANKVSYYTPYLTMDKSGILNGLSEDCGTLLKQDIYIDFDRVLYRTNTSYKPIQHNDKWYSDYKSASSIERIEAFIRLGRKDPVDYADETGPVTWEVAKTHAENVLKQGKSNS